MATLETLEDRIRQRARDDLKRDVHKDVNAFVSKYSAVYISRSGLHTSVHADEVDLQTAMRVIEDAIVRALSKIREQQAITAFLEVVERHRSADEIEVGRTSVGGDPNVED